VSLRRRSVVSPGPLSLAVLAALVLLANACDKLKATTDRAMLSLQLKGGCPDPVDGRAAGADSPEGALACFRQGIEQQSASLLLRVTCKSRSPVSCKQTDATVKEAEKTIPELKKLPWNNVLGKWNETEGKVTVFAVDTFPGEKRVTSVVTCKIVEGDRWAVCEVNETRRDTAEQKMK
jgi:hypothetical protein